MAELVFRRVGEVPALPMVCMNCGRPAVHRDEQKVFNPAHDPDSQQSRRASRVDLVDLLAALRAFVLRWTRYEQGRSTTGLIPDHTLVAFITCDRHRNYRRWYQQFVLVIGTMLLAGWIALFALLPFVEAFFWGLVHRQAKELGCC